MKYLKSIAAAMLALAAAPAFAGTPTLDRSARTAGSEPSTITSGCHRKHEGRDGRDVQTAHLSTIPVVVMPPQNAPYDTRQKRLHRRQLVRFA